MKDLLFVRPADDSAAIQIAAWGQALLHMVVGRSHIDLCAGQVTRQVVDLHLRTGVRHLFWFGHGTDTELTSFGSAIVDLVNLANLRRGMVVAIACYAGGTLGQSASGLGNIAAFLGFDDEFGFPAAAPLPMAQAVVGGLRCLFTEGHDLECASEQLRDALDRARLDYKMNGPLYGLTDSETRIAWLFAKSNRYSLRLLGRDQSAVI